MHEGGYATQKNTHQMNGITTVLQHLYCRRMADILQRDVIDTDDAVI